MKSRALFVCVVGSVMLWAGSALAADQSEKEKRVPIKPAMLEGKRLPIVETQGNNTQIRLNRYEQVVSVVRTRSEGKRFATFHAEPSLIETGAVIAFEIRSEGPTGSLVRWRCVAKRDVAECLGAPVRLKYLSDDQRMVLTARLKPASEIEAVEPKLPSS